MLTHVVWWTLKPEAEGKTAEENARFLRESLEGLRGKIPALKELSVSLSFLPSTTEDVGLLLVTRHEDAAGLAAYAEHPLHVAVGEYLKKVVASRRAIDAVTE